MKEIRYTQIPPELTDTEDSRRISGYALVFESDSNDLGGFTESISRHALEGVIEKSDVLCLLDHDINRGVLARSRFGKGSLSLEVDEKGLRYTFEAPNTALGSEVLEYLKRQDLTQSSFGFTVNQDKWEKRSDGSIHRTIESIKKIYDVSMVFFPAYDQTSVQIDKRGLEILLNNEMEEKIENRSEDIKEQEQENRSSDEQEQEKEETVSEENNNNPEEEREDNKENECRSEETNNPEDIKEKSEDENSEKEEKSEDEKEKPEVDSEKRNAEKNNINIISHMKENFSLIKTIKDIAEKRQISEIAQELNERGQAESRNAGVGVGGHFTIPVSNIETRAAGVFAQQGATSGGYDIATDKLGILEPLYANLMLGQLGCTMMPNLHGDVSIPTYSGTSAKWAGEIDKAENGAGDWGEVKMSPKRLTTTLEISFLFLEQQTNAAEEMLKRDIVTAISNKLEATIFGDNPSTANRPAGLLNGVTADSNAITYDDILLMEAELDHANVYGPRKYVLSPAARAILRATKRDAGSGLFVADNSSVLGVDYLYSSNVAQKGLILGAWQDLCVGQWGGIQLVVDNVSLADQGKLKLVVNSFWDVVVRRPESFVKKVLA